MIGVQGGLGAPNLPPLVLRPGEDVVGVGGDLAPATLLTAYSIGVFPMGVGPEGAPPLAWWCPAYRGILPPGRLRVSRSLRKSAARYEVTVDTAFAEVVAGCADPSRSGRWITDEIASAYTTLHDLGHAHSVEVWEAGELVGGLYGVSVGGLFAGESMFHRARDASKVALMRLVDIVADDGDPARLIDVQWATPHLESLGVIEVERSFYLASLARATALIPPWGFAPTNRRG
ncbi:MAG: leucyl/phenylalanyl-tRNA--protein transferase [Dermatophilus congolensis]|nr:leucyl/phenylalanyl-tRNA--protein transferase [Dermatophilus congolensis]